MDMRFLLKEDKMDRITKEVYIKYGSVQSESNQETRQTVPIFD